MGLVKWGNLGGWKKVWTKHQQVITILNFMPLNFKLVHLPRALLIRADSHLIQIKTSIIHIVAVLTLKLMGNGNSYKNIKSGDMSNIKAMYALQWMDGWMRGFNVTFT